MGTRGKGRVMTNSTSVQEKTTSRIDTIFDMTKVKQAQGATLVSIRDMHLHEDTLEAVILWLAEHHPVLPSDETVQKFRDHYIEQPLDECVLCVNKRIDRERGEVPVWFIANYAWHKDGKFLREHKVKLSLKIPAGTKFALL